MNEVLQKLLLVLAISSLSVISACTHSMIGQTQPAGNYPYLGSGEYGHHIVEFERGAAELDYYWTINRENATLTFQGTFNIYGADWKAVTNAPWQSGKLIIELFLLNNNYQVIEVERIFIPIDDTTYEENEFKRTFPYRSEYKYVSYRMSYSAEYLE